MELWRVKFRPGAYTSYVYALPANSGAQPGDYVFTPLFKMSKYDVVQLGVIVGPGGPHRDNSRPVSATLLPKALRYGEPVADGEGD